MKILFVSTTGGPINAFLIPHIKLLKQLGHEVDIACNIVRDVNPELKKIVNKIHNVEFERKPLNKNTINLIKKIKKIIIIEGYDLVHTHTPIASFLTRFACRRVPNLKVLYTVHGFHFLKGASLKNWLLYYPLEKIASKWTDGLITMNEEDYLVASSMKLREGSSVFKTHGVGVNLERFSPQTLENKIKLREEYEFSEKEFILTYVAELNFNKHQDLLINAVSNVKEKIPNIKLLLVGDGPSKSKYELQVEELGLKDNVSFLGFRKDVPKLLKVSNVAVASSRREGLPVNLMEAMATGLPLIVTNIRGHKDLVENEVNGFVVGVDHVQAFTEAIYKVYTSEEVRYKFKQNNLKLVKKYSIDNVLREMKEIYSYYLKES